MSYDLTIRADRNYSQFTPLAALTDFIRRLPHVQPNGPSDFVLNDPPKRYMNISLEVANEMGDSVAAHEAGGDRINCIRLNIPYAHLGEEAERDYFPMAQEITRHVGWQLYDAQTGEYVTEETPPDLERGDFVKDVLRALGLAVKKTGRKRATAKKAARPAAKARKPPAGKKPKKGAAQSKKPPAAKAKAKAKPTRKKPAARKKPRRG